MGDFSEEFDELVPEFSNGQTSESQSQEEEKPASVDEEKAGEEEKVGDEEGEGTEAGEALANVSEEEVAVIDNNQEENASVIETPAEAAPIVETPAAVDPLIQELREQNKQLMEMVQKMTTQPIQAPLAEEVKKDELEVKVPTSLEETLADVNLDEVFSDREKFIGLMEQVAGFAREQAVQRVATTLPQYVVAQVRQTNYLQKETKNFYDKHKGLVPFKKAVGIVTNEVVEEHPDWDLPKVLGEVATRSYTLLNLKQEAENFGGNPPPPAPSNNSGNPKPALNTSTSGRRNAPQQLTKLQQEIADIL